MQAANNSINSEGPLLPLLDSLNIQLDNSYNSSQDQIDEERCYLMEIEQLKRQNNFLKKKIAELNKRHPVITSMITKRKSLPSNIKPAESISFLPQQNYIVSFFQEITRLIESFSDLFKVSVQSNLKSTLRQHQEFFDQLTSSNGDHLNRRLSRVLLQPEQKRYGELLGIFQSYYTETTEKSSSLKQKVQILTTQAIQLGKQMAQSLRHRQKMKTSRMYSGFNQRDYSKNMEEVSILKQSHIKSTCTDSQLDLSGCKIMLSKDKMFQHIF